MNGKRKTYYKLENGQLLRARKRTCPEGWSEVNPLEQQTKEQVKSLAMSVASALFNPVTGMIGIAPQPILTKTVIVEQIPELEAMVTVTKEEIPEEEENEEVATIEEPSVVVPTEPVATASRKTYEELEVENKKLRDQVGMLHQQMHGLQDAELKTMKQFIVTNKGVSEELYYELKNKWAGAVERIEHLTKTKDQTEKFYQDTRTKYLQALDDLKIFDGAWTSFVEAKAIIRQLFDGIRMQESFTGKEALLDRISSILERLDLAEKTADVSVIRKRIKELLLKECNHFGLQ